MKFGVLVRITRKSIGFWYQMDGSHAVALDSGEASHEVPLCFYVTRTELTMGSLGREHAQRNDPNAFVDYFDLVGREATKLFHLHGEERSVKQLLVLGIEQQLMRILRSELYSDEPIEAVRPDLCLRLWFGPDVLEKERMLVEKLLTEAGYSNLARTNADAAWVESLRVAGVHSATGPLLQVQGLHGDLHLRFYRLPETAVLAVKLLEDMGTDPRVRILAELLVEDICEGNRGISLDRRSEVEQLLPLAADLLDAGKPLLRGDALLSSGKAYYYNIRLRDVEERMAMRSDFQKVVVAIDDLLRSQGADTNTILLLDGERTDTPFFKERLQYKFPNVKGCGARVPDEQLKVMFGRMAANGYAAELPVALSSNQSNVVRPKTQPVVPPPSPGKKPALPAPPQSGRSSVIPSTPPPPPGSPPAPVLPPVKPPSSPPLQPARAAVPPPPPQRVVKPAQPPPVRAVPPPVTKPASPTPSAPKPPPPPVKPPPPPSANKTSAKK